PGHHYRPRGPGARWTNCPIARIRLIRVKAAGARVGKTSPMHTTTSPVQPLRNWRFDASLLRRYDRPGPRYTSYPTAPHFAEGFGEEDFRDIARRSNDDPIPRQL